jgi:hypothetical protein
MAVKWGGHWLALEREILPNGPVIEIFDTLTGEFQSTAPLPNDPDHWLSEYDWISTGSQVVIGALLASGQWTFFDPQTGSPADLAPQVVLISQAAGSNSVALSFSVSPIEQYTTCDHNRVWTSSTSGPFGYQDCEVAISPDGQSFAYMDDGGSLVIQTGGTLTSIAIPGLILNLFWGPTQWAAEGSISGEVEVEPVS